MYHEHLNDLVDIEYEVDLEQIDQDEVLPRSRQDLLRLLELYYLAEKLLIEDLKLQICDQFHEITNRGIDLLTLAPSTILTASWNSIFAADSPLWQSICCELAIHLRNGDGRPLEHY